MEMWMAVDEGTKGKNGSGMCWLLVPYLMPMLALSGFLRCIHAR